MKSNEEIKNSYPELMYQTLIDFDSRQMAVASALSMFKAALTNKKRNNVKKFIMKNKRKKSKSQVFDLCKKRVKITETKNWISFDRVKYYFKFSSIISAPEINNDCKVQRVNDKYYLLIPCSVSMAHKQCDDSIVALDPGVRTFQTFYSDTGACGKIHDTIAINKAYAGLKRVDRIKEHINNKSHSCREKKRLRQYCNRVTTKSSNIIDNFHRHVAKYLLTNYDVIIIPTFGVKGMISCDRSLSKEVKRKMLLLSHYKFRSKLETSVQFYTNKYVVVCNEAYTSKTCSDCGNLKMDLGSNEIYECNKCNLRVDRDVNAAKNIYIKTVNELHG